MAVPKKSKLKTNRPDNYESSTYTSTMDSRLENNISPSVNSTSKKFKDVPVPSEKPKKKKNNKLVD